MGHLYPRAGRHDRGFSLMELLVAMLMGLALLTSFSVTFVENRKFLAGELRRVETTSNLQIAVELLGSEIRKAGAYTPDLFPSFELIDGGEASDTLILRYGLLEGATLCRGVSGAAQNVTFVTDSGGTVQNESGGTVMVDDGTGTLVPLTSTACRNDSDASDSMVQKTVDKWSSIIEKVGNEAFGMLYDRATKKVHGFTPISVIPPTSTRVALRVAPKGGAWPDTFSPLSSSFYLIDEITFEVDQNKILTMKRNGSNDILQIVGGITKFDVQVQQTVTDPLTSIKTTSTKNQFVAADSWRTIDFASVKLHGQPQRGEGKERIAESSFTLRNVFSAKVQ